MCLRFSGAHLIPPTRGDVDLPLAKCAQDLPAPGLESSFTVSTSIFLAVAISSSLARSDVASSTPPVVSPREARGAPPSRAARSGLLVERASGMDRRTVTGRPCGIGPSSVPGAASSGGCGCARSSAAPKVTARFAGDGNAPTRPPFLLPLPVRCYSLHRVQTCAKRPRPRGPPQHRAGGRLT